MRLFWVPMMVGALFLVRWLVEREAGPAQAAGDRSALQILKQHYVRGEISREEFEGRMARLLPPLGHA